ncbi:hypothetical protein MRB53_028759 [Persea americana]|uniref:Uncharacterized protein n=1 Tax=Persea americana TaxID=3435 RepID=A0ACC2KGZ6_PERAE|nr:hypothetical protein MRB53_028759 [Persea americana]
MKQRLETRICSSFGVDQPSSLFAHCSLKLLSLLFFAKISRILYQDLLGVDVNSEDFASISEILRGVCGNQLPFALD